MIRRIYTVALIVSFLVLTGCAGILQSDLPADRTYWLEPLLVPSIDNGNDSRPALSIVVKAAPGLDTDRLLILGSGSQLQYYSAARWPDNVPEVLESLLRQSLESTGKFSRVYGSHAVRSSDWQVELVVTKFFTVASSQSRILMALSGYINCSKSNYSILLSEETPIEDNRLSLIVSAYQKSINRVSSDLIHQLAERCGPKT